MEAQVLTLHEPEPRQTRAAALNAIRAGGAKADELPITKKKPSRPGATP